MTPPVPPVPLVLTAPTADALRARARAVAAAPVAAPALPALGHDLAARADPAHDARIVTLAAGPDDVARLADAVPCPATPAGRLAFLFSGQSSQRPGMGDSLAAAFPAFAASRTELDRAVAAHLDRPLSEVRAGTPESPDRPLLDRPEYTQPALLVHALALTDLLATLGVGPDLVAGHSLGEVLAAAAAGVWSRADAGTLVAERGRLIGSLPAGGGMVAIEASEDEVSAALPGPDVVLSAVHGPRAVVVAGPRARVREVGARFAARGVRTAELAMDVAAHSPAVAPMLGPLAAAVEAHPARPTSVGLVGNADGALVAPEAPASSAHWVRHCRATVRWADVVTALRAEGAATYLEIGPSGVLSRLSEGCLPAAERAALVPACGVEPDEATAFVDALVRLEHRGHRVHWAGLPARTGAPVTVTGC